MRTRNTISAISTQPARYEHMMRDHARLLLTTLTLRLTLDPVRITLRLWLFASDAYDATLRGDNHALVHRTVR